MIRVARALHWYSNASTHRHAWDEIFSLGACGSVQDEAVLLNFLGWARKGSTAVNVPQVALRCAHNCRNV